VSVSWRIRIFHNIFPEPGYANIIFFLTDGEPSSGETNWNNIIANFKRENYHNYAVFPIAIGSSNSLYDSINRLAIETHGVARRIIHDYEVHTLLENYYDKVRVQNICRVPNFFG